MHVRTGLCAALCLALMPATVLRAAELRAEELTAARSLAVGETMLVQAVPLGGSRERSVRMKRIEVYAADARIWVLDKEGKREIPRSNWIHLVAAESTPEAPRIALSLAPDGREGQGVLLSDDGRTYNVLLDARGGGFSMSLRSATETSTGLATDFTCSNSEHSIDAMQGGNWQEILPSALNLPVVTAGSRQAVIAIDTDNELLAQKFSDNTTSANNYLAAMFAAMNVVYERDLDLTLLQGTTILRLSSSADPYAASGADAIDQLDEFGEVWSATQSGVSRAFSMLLSGKSSSPNSASGIAWVLGNVNYCNQRGATFGGCTDGTCTFGHYSASQLFKFAGSTAANDLLVVAHELGHNFGAFHAHCSDNVTGEGSTASNTIDQCFNTEGGCFAGTKVCPAPTTVNGVSNVRGTLMSYCHLSGLAGCNSSTVFADAHRTLINPRVANNLALGCFTAPSPTNVAPTLNAISNPAAILEDASQQTVNLSGIGDGNGNTQTLTVSASSGNTALIPNPSVSYSSPNSTGSISYTPVANASGSAVITVTVTDNGGTANGGVNTFSRTFTVNVTAVNDAPTLNAINNPATINVGAGLQTINLSGIGVGPGDPAQTLTVTAVSSNTGLIPNPTVSYTSPNATGSLSYTPVAGQSGSSVVTVTVTDNGGTANGGQNTFVRTFTQNVSGGADVVFANGFE